MNAKQTFLFLLEAAIWYGFIYYWLYALKNPVELWSASLVLLVLAYLGVLVCPWVHVTDAWKRLWGSN